MDDFKKNNCRICNKVFCCKNCREKHETKEHNVFLDCDLCIYGTLVLVNTETEFLNHLKSAHLPFHCKTCKRVFSTVDDLLLHRKCSVVFKKEFSPKLIIANTPIRTYTDEDYSSPVETYKNTLNVILHSLATSTPMQRSEEPNVILDNIHTAITPVENSHSKSIIKKVGDSNHTDQSMKRRVTFCETPITDTRKNKPFARNRQASIEEEEAKMSNNLGNNGKYGQEMSISSASSSANFYSAKESPSETKDRVSDLKNIAEVASSSKNADACETDKSNDSNKENNEKVNSIKEGEDVPNENDASKEEANSTLWISALNTSSFEKNEDIPTSSLPTTTNNNDRRKINVVTPVIKRKNTKLMFNIPLHLSSTPVVPQQLISEDHKETVPILPKTLLASGKVENIVSPHFQIGDKETRKINLSTKISEKHCLSDTSVGTEHTRSIWISMTKIVKNAIHNFSTTDISRISNSSSSLKRSFSDYDCSDGEGPRYKRYKLTDIKCRPTIRPLSSMEFSQRASSLELVSANYLVENPVGGCNTCSQSTKTFADKATQTDFS